MPDRLTRLTSIITHLQSKRVITAGEIASRFEISLRTAYRDMKTLADAGVPIGSEPGVGFFLANGYTLPPVMFTEEEAGALITAQKLIEKNSDGSLIKNYESAVIKIRALLTGREKNRLELLEDRISSSIPGKSVQTSELLDTIQNAITQSAVMEIVYHSIYRDEITIRRIEPFALYFTDTSWIVISWCRLRNDEREFRLDRIRSAKKTTESFIPRAFSFSDYIQKHTDTFKKDVDTGLS